MTESNDDLMAERDDHPDELLAGLVDGTLDERDHGRVEAHLTDCPACREDLPLALRAATAVSRLPELHAPAGLTRSVVDQARPSGRPNRRVAWLAAPVAAAVIGLAVWAALSAGRNGPVQEAERSHSSGGGAGAAPVAGTTDRRIRTSNVNFDAAKIQALAAQLASASQRDLLARSPSKRSAPEAFGPADPLACVTRTAAPTNQDRLLEVLVARFEGTPAYVAVFEHRPGAGQPPSLLTIWVASVHGCRLLHYASQPLNR
jgi:hypothetical protein